MTSPKNAARLAARLASLTAIVGLLATTAAMAATCGQVNGKWTKRFNRSVYDCDGPSPAAECSVLVDLKSCCIAASTQQERKDCVNAICLANETLLQGININTNSCH